MHGPAITQQGTQVDNDFWGGLAKFAAGGGGFAAVLAFTRWLINWLTGRHDRREDLIEQKDAALDERWAKYTKKLEDRCEKLENRQERMEAEVEECHQSKRELETRIARLEGFDQGMGERRQEEQRTASFKDVISDRVKGGRG